ncbi:glycosyltransferase [Aerococcus urinaeequi]|uniref:glycosyltransferase n=1 Tax=Aerococcus urinaeequi TaxID=51665 RepID=UPI003D6B38BB
MKKIVIISAFETYQGRVDSVKKYFSEYSDVQIIKSDFEHFSKKRITKRNPDEILINTISYKKNISIRRLLSHYFFSRDISKILKEQNPDMIYALVPPNSLIDFIAKYKKRHKGKQSKIFFDIIDLWPETMPISKLKDNFAFRYWSQIRNKNLYIADEVITECDYFQEKLPKEVEGTTIYLSRPYVDKDVIVPKSIDELNLCYLGSINNIIDIDFIVKLSKEISKRRKVLIHIIGEGEKSEEFFDQLKTNNIEYKYYGKVYNEQKKQNIFNKCHFGLNVMKQSVFVGLTMKSIDYFEGGLPVINTIRGDSQKFVEEEKCGLNFINRSDITNFTNEILSLSNKDIYEMKKNSRKLFIDNFTNEVFAEHMDKLLLNYLTKSE